MIIVVVCSAAVALALIMTARGACSFGPASPAGRHDLVVRRGIVGAAAALAPIAGQEGLTRGRCWSPPARSPGRLRLGLHIMRRTLRAATTRATRPCARSGCELRLPPVPFLQVQAAAALVLVICVPPRAQHRASRLGDASASQSWPLRFSAKQQPTRNWPDLQVAQRERCVCEIGLWRYSRHPNYFFEWLAWLSYPVIAVGLPADNLYGLIALPPAMIYWLLVHVSGIPRSRRIC